MENFPPPPRQCSKIKSKNVSLFNPGVHLCAGVHWCGVRRHPRFKILIWKRNLIIKSHMDPYRWLLKLAGERPGDWMTGAATSPVTLGAATAVLIADATKTFDWTLVLGVVVVITAWTEKPPICNAPLIPACRGPLLSWLWLLFRTFDLRPPERKGAASAPIWPDLSPSPTLLCGFQFAVLRLEAVFCGTSWKRLFRAVEPDKPGENGPRSLLLLKVLKLLPFSTGKPSSRSPIESTVGIEAWTILDILVTCWEWHGVVLSLWVLLTKIGGIYRTHPGGVWVVWKLVWVAISKSPAAATAAAAIVAPLKSPAIWRLVWRWPIFFIISYGTLSVRNPFLGKALCACKNHQCRATDTLVTNMIIFRKFPKFWLSTIII